MAMHTLTFHCVENISNISATGTHSCREGEVCALVTLTLGSHGKNVMVTVSWLGQFCVVALKHNFHAVVAPQTVSCTTGGAKSHSWGEHPWAPSQLIIHVPHLSLRHLSREWIITNESNPDLCAQVLLTQDNSLPWVRTWRLTLYYFIPGISNTTGLIQVSHPTMRRAGLEILDLPFRQRGAPPVGKDLLKGENGATPSFLHSILLSTACLDFCFNSDKVHGIAAELPAARG